VGAGNSGAAEAYLKIGNRDLAARVIDVGNVTEAEKAWLLQHAGLVIYPSIYEGFGIVPFEAAARSTPALSTRFTAVGEVLGDDVLLLVDVERGKGPAALFLHGFPLNGFQWRGIIPELAKMRRCLAPDLLALGYTEVDAGQSLAAKAQVAMLAQFLDKLSIASVDIIANDSGGAIAQLFVTTHPQRARSLLLTNCDTEPDSPPPAVTPVITLARAGSFADEWLVPWL